MSWSRDATSPAGSSSSTARLRRDYAGEATDEASSTMVVAGAPVGAMPAATQVYIATARDRFKDLAQGTLAGLLDVERSVEVSAFSTLSFSFCRLEGVVDCSW